MSVTLSCLFIAALWSPGLLAILCVTFSCVFCHFPMLNPGSGVVLDCISWIFFETLQMFLSRSEDVHDDLL